MEQKSKANNLKRRLGCRIEKKCKLKTQQLQIQQILIAKGPTSLLLKTLQRRFVRRRRRMDVGSKRSKVGKIKMLKVKFQRRPTASYNTIAYTPACPNSVWSSMNFLRRTRSCTSDHLGASTYFCIFVCADVCCAICTNFRSLFCCGDANILRTSIYRSRLTLLMNNRNSLSLSLSPSPSP